VASELRLFEYRLPVALYLETAAARRNQLDVGSRKRIANLGRQTGGPRLVTSDGAVLDRDRHRNRVTGGLEAQDVVNRSAVR